MFRQSARPCCCSCAHCPMAACRPTRTGGMNMGGMPPGMGGMGGGPGGMDMASLVSALS